MKNNDSESNYYDMWLHVHLYCLSVCLCSCATGGGRWQLLCNNTNSFYCFVFFKKKSRISKIVAAHADTSRTETRIWMRRLHVSHSVNVGAGFGFTNTLWLKGGKGCKSEELCFSLHYSHCSNNKGAKGPDALSGCKCAIKCISVCSHLFLWMIQTPSQNNKTIYVCPSSVTEWTHICSNLNNDKIIEQIQSCCQSNGEKGHVLFLSQSVIHSLSGMKMIRGRGPTASTWWDGGVKMGNRVGKKWNSN